VSRQPRSDLPDGVYHVTAQAVSGSSLFNDDEDRPAFVWLLGALTARCGLVCWGIRTTSLLDAGGGACVRARFRGAARARIGARGGLSVRGRAPAPRAAARRPECDPCSRGWGLARLKLRCAEDDVAVLTRLCPNAPVLRERRVRTGDGAAGQLLSTRARLSS
jgi:hypothetical protein